MSGVLETIGITEPAPTPGEFDDQKALQEQMGTALGGLSGTVGTVNSLTAVAGVPASPELENQLKSIQQQAGDLQASSGDLSPAQIEKKRQDLEKNATAYKEKQTAEKFAKDKARWEKGLEILRKRKIDLEKSNVSDEIKKTHDQLLQDAEKGYTEFLKTDPSKPKEGFQAAVTPPTPPPATIDDIAQRWAINRAIMNQERLKEDPMYAAKQTAKVVLRYASYVGIGLGMMTGAIVATNIYRPYELNAAEMEGKPRSDSIWKGIYYAIFGALLFPLTLLMGFIKFMPGFLSLFTNPADAAKEAAKAAAEKAKGAILGKLGGMFGGKDEDEPPPPPPPPPPPKKVAALLPLFKVRVISKLESQEDDAHKPALTDPPLSPISFTVPSWIPMLGGRLVQFYTFSYKHPESEYSDGVLDTMTTGVWASCIISAILLLQGVIARFLGEDDDF
jgi:hypothetical protein